MAGTGNPACAIMASSAVVFSVTVLPPVLGPLMMSWRSSAVSSSVSGHDVGRPSRAGAFPAADGARLQVCNRSASKGRRHAVVVARKARPRQQAVDQRQHARAFDQAVRVAAHLARERDKDAVNLRLLFFDAAAPARCSARWFRAAPRRPSAPTSWRRESRRVTRRFSSARTGITKRSPRMVIRSSCVGAFARRACAAPRAGSPR